MVDLTQFCNSLSFPWIKQEVAAEDDIVVHGFICSYHCQKNPQEELIILWIIGVWSDISEEMIDLLLLKFIWNMNFFTLVLFHHFLCFSLLFLFFGKMWFLLCTDKFSICFFISIPLCLYWKSDSKWKVLSLTFSKRLRKSALYYGIYLTLWHYFERCQMMTDDQFLSVSFERCQMISFLNLPNWRCRY